MQRNSGTARRCSSAGVPTKSLCLSWLRAWRDEAAERRSSSARIYNTALQALKSCPLYEHDAHPAQLMSLDAVGPTLAQRLAEQLKDWCKDNNMQMPARATSSAQARQASSYKSDSFQRKVSWAAFSTTSSGSSEDESRQERTGTGQTQSVGAQARQQSAASSKSKRDADARNRTSKTAAAAAAPRDGSAPISKPVKQYIPAHRSGAHGILVALFSMTREVPRLDDVAASSDDRQASCSLPPSMKRTKEPVPFSYLSKQQIIDLAKSFSDASYEQRALPPAMARGPISFNTAWSAMKTLIGRGYVYRTGNPPRFGLSALGFEVAEQCAIKDDVQAGQAISLEQGFEGEEKLPMVSAAGKGQRVQAAGQAGPARSGNTKTFCFTYVDPSGAHVLYRNKAAVRLSDVDYTPLYRIVYPTDQRDHVFVKSCLDTASEEANVERSGDVELLEGWVRESASNERASGLAPSTAPSHRGSLASCEDIPSIPAGQRGAADKELNAERLAARPAASINAGRASSGPGTQSLTSRKHAVAVSGRTRSNPKRSRKRSKISASSSSSDSESESESDGRDIEEETTTTCASHQPSKRASAATTSVLPHGASKTVARMARSNTDRSRRKPLSPAAKAGTSPCAPCLQLLSSSPPVQEQCAEQCNSSPPPLSSLLSNRFARQALRPKTPSDNTQPASRRSASGSTASSAQKKRRNFCDAEIIELC
ncbi:hypothetical protein IE81DRAFT_348727 [Ceraceosorus guamensis]|uniref:Crossover junction endonuclease MUS81 n=1 Tax=Ceraceosorus guamensis TaxID=1522189 RepID=A0A316VTU6_9BASI|nr:hypothetical protein IE81DRAFT_348727 [Ceraceosorus guamensis]PWN41026.1 hypothetical protein IE81DRAFT_348727 [Ceraceosorus guamensis]